MEIRGPAFLEHCMSNRPEDKPTFAVRLDTDRVLGVLITIGGLAAMYYFILRQAIAATRHDPAVFLSTKGVMLSPVGLALGVVYTVYGSRVTDFLGDNKQRPTRTTRILIGLFCVGDSFLYWWLKRFIEGYRYVFSS
jgi:hypothetical protein